MSEEEKICSLKALLSQYGRWWYDYNYDEYFDSFIYNESEPDADSLSARIDQTTTQQRLNIFKDTEVMLKAATYGHKKVAKLVLDSLDAGCRFELLESTGNYERAPCFYYAITHGHCEIVKIILDSIDEAKRFKLLKQRWGLKFTTMADVDDVSVLECIQSSVSEDQWFELLITGTALDPDGLVGMNMWEGSPSTLKFILDSVDAEKQLCLLERSDKFSTLFIDLDEVEETCEILETYTTIARITSALRIEAHRDREDAIFKIQRENSLTIQQINELSPQSKRYIIPYEQRKAKRYALILFNTHSRQGAVAEAGRLETALTTAGCDVIKMEWSVGDEMQRQLGDTLSRVSSDCSLLIICIMSHGSTGLLTGSDGNGIAVSNVLHQISHSDLPSHVPMVMMIQACQNFSTGIIPEDPLTDPAVASSNIQDNKHIVLRRPHTVLPLATVTGGVAYRGLYTGALSDEISKADGHTDIHEMHVNAVRVMRREGDQTPEYRDTLQSHLILPPCPPAINNIGHTGGTCYKCMVIGTSTMLVTQGEPATSV